MTRPHITPVDPTPEQEVLIDALAMSALRESGSALLAATMLLAAATKLLFGAFPPKQAIETIDEIIEGGRQAVREVMN